MNKLSIDRQAQIIKALCEGNSIRSTARITDTAINTVVKLLRDLGTACIEYQNEHLRNLTCERIQCDEIWSFCYAKQKNIPEDKHGHRAYLWAVEHAFGSEVDYAMLIKLYGQQPEAEKRYSPAQCIAAESQIIQGNPDKTKISTSYVERQNLTMRMCMRRFTRLTNAFSKKIENHALAIALHFMYYNFARPHKSLANPYPRTPAMAAGITDHVWTIEEIIQLVNC